MGDKRPAICERYTLPSNGYMYGNDGCNPEIKIRCMTTRDEEILVSNNKQSALKTLCEVLDDCVTGDLPVSTYDMCLGDYQFILHKIRTITYGKEYKMLVGCPHCMDTVKDDAGKNIEVPHKIQAVVDLDTLKINELTKPLDKEQFITLPANKDKLKIKFETPRLLDFIADKALEMKKVDKLSYVPQLSVRLMTLIETVNDKPLDIKAKEDYVNSLSARDAKYIVRKIEELNAICGIDPTTVVKCDACGGEVLTYFRQGPEFLNPTFDE